MLIDQKKIFVLFIDLTICMDAYGTKQLSQFHRLGHKQLKTTKIVWMHSKWCKFVSLGDSNDCEVGRG